MKQKIKVVDGKKSSSLLKIISTEEDRGHIYFIINLFEFREKKMNSNILFTGEHKPLL